MSSDCWSSIGKVVVFVGVVFVVTAVVVVVATVIVVVVVAATMDADSSASPARVKHAGDAVGISSTEATDAAGLSLPSMKRECVRMLGEDSGDLGEVAVRLGAVALAVVAVAVWLTAVAAVAVAVVAFCFGVRR